MSRKDVEFPCPVRRLRVVWRDGEWNVVKEVRVPSMTLPRSAGLPRVEAGRGLSGFWYELRDASGDVLYRRILESPFNAVEVFEEDGTVHREGSTTREVMVDVLVPDLEGATEVALFSDDIPALESGSRKPAEMVGRLSLEGPPKRKRKRRG